MSALPDTTETRTRLPKHRVAIRNGRIVVLKVCCACFEEKICTTGEDSEFPPREAKADGSPAWRSYCKVCLPQRSKAYRKANSARLKEQSRERRREKRKTDPEWAEQERKRHRESKRRAWADPVKREKILARDRERKRKLRERDRERINEDNRMWYALRREREGKTVRSRTATIDEPASTAPASTFRRWLVEYAQRANLGTERSKLAWDLGLNPRRVHAVLSREYETVSLDVVSCALTHAAFLVEIDGRVIATIDDLYPEERELSDNENENENEVTQ